MTFNWLHVWGSILGVSWYSKYPKTALGTSSCFFSSIFLLSYWCFRAVSFMSALSLESLYFAEVIFLGAFNKQGSTKSEQIERGPNMQDSGKTPAENVVRLKGKIYVVWWFFGFKNYWATIVSELLRWFSLIDLQLSS